jgi:Receptor family ligand binding region
LWGSETGKAMFTRLSCLLILLSTAVTAEIVIDFFDTLRNDPSLSTSISNTSANNLFTVTDSKGKEYRLAQISGFLPFSNGSVLRDGVENDGFALLLAILHFNNVGLAPFLDSEEISKCNIKLTAEMFDTQFSPINSTRLFTRILQRNNTLQSPIPSAVIGAYRSAVTSPLAILTGVNNIPQISYASTSSDFDVKEQYPFFGRTIMSSVGEAQITIDYFNKVLKATYIGVLFVTDSFGSALQKAFQDAASNVGITTDSFAFSFSDADGLEIQNAVKSLKKTQFNIFYVIAFELHYEPIMKAAYDGGLVGDDKVWIFNGFDPSAFQRSLEYPSG